MRETSLVYALLIVISHCLLSGCATMDPEKRLEHKNSLDIMGEEAVSELIRKYPDLTTMYQEAVGYMVIRMKVTKIPFLGFGGGEGMVEDRVNNDRSYVKVSRLDIGGGIGVRRYKVIIIFSDTKKLSQAKKSLWLFDQGMEVAGAKSGESQKKPDTGTGKGYASFILVEGGAAATVTIRAIRSKPFLE